MVKLALRPTAHQDAAHGESTVRTDCIYSAVWVRMEWQDQVMFLVWQSEVGAANAWGRPIGKAHFWLAG